MYFKTLILLALTAINSEVAASPSKKQTDERIQLTPWKNVSITCGDWLPDVSDLKASMHIQQYQDCTQRRIRERITYDSNTGVRPTIETLEDFVKTRNSRTTRGGKDEIIAIKKSKQFSGWEPSETQHCEPWPDLKNNIPKGTIFSEYTWCRGKEQRHRAVYEFWLSGKRTARPDLQEIETRNGLFLRVHTQAGEAETWVDDGYQVSPAVMSARTCRPVQHSGSWGFGKLVEFSTVCDELWVEPIKHMQRSITGRTRTKFIEERKQKQQTIGFVSVIGMNDYVTHEEVQYTDWEPKKGSPQDCFDAPSFPGKLLPWGMPYVDVKQCVLQQSRRKEDVRIYATGHTERTVISLEFRDESVLQTLSALGGEDVLLSTGLPKQGDWGPLSEPNCTEWQPSITAVERGVSYFQTLTCYQTKSRPVFQEEIWRSGVRLKQLSDETIQITQAQTKEVIGVAIIAKERIEFTLNGAPTAGKPWSISSNAKQIRITALLSQAPKSPISVQVGSVILDLPELSSKTQTFYYRLQDYGIASGNTEVSIQGVAGAVGEISLQLE